MTTDNDNSKVPLEQLKAAGEEVKTAKNELESIILNHGLFISLVVFITIAAVFLLIYGQFCNPPPINDPEPKVEDVVLYPLDRGTTKLPMIINLVDGDFSEKEIVVLEKATKTWSVETNGLVQISLNKNWSPPYLFSSESYVNFGEKTMWKRSGAEDNEVVKLQLKYSICADAVSTGDFVMVLDDFHNMSPEKLYVIALHEWGHQLGLEHIKPEYPALMNVGGNDGKITKFDQLTFCHLYPCKK